MSWRNLPIRNLPIRNLPVVVKNQLQRVESSPQTARAIAVMDTGIRFMTDGSYACANPAIGAVRAPLKAGLWVMMALAGVTLVWGTLAPIDSAAVATGTVKLLSNKKTVQHLEGGIIKQIMVKEGDTVAAGQPLIRLSDTAASASRDALQAQLYAAQASQARLMAERDRQDHVTFSQELTDGAKNNAELGRILAAQTQLFSSEVADHKAKLAVLDQRIAQSRDEIEGLKSQVGGASGQIDLLNKEIDTVQTLLAKGYATKTRLFELQRNASELTGNKGQYQANIAKTQQNIAETEMAIIDQQKEFETKNSQDMRDAQAQIVELENKLKAASDVEARTLITAPVSGVVTGLKFHTAGGVITPSTPIMDIVPQNDQLVIEAHVKPNDIGIVRPGLKANILFTAYDTRSTPKIPGKVTLVSPDTFTDEHSVTPSSYYLAQVEVDKAFLNKLKTKVELYPGMPAEVMIRTGSRSLISYLFSPITDSMGKAFREQ